MLRKATFQKILFSGVTFIVKLEPSEFVFLDFNVTPGSQLVPCSTAVRIEIIVKELGSDTFCPSLPM